MGLVGYFEAAGAAGALVDFAAFLCFLTFTVDFVSVVGLVVSCFAAAKAEAPNMERASTAVIAVFMAVSFPFSEVRSFPPSLRETKGVLNGP